MKQETHDIILTLIAIMAIGTIMGGFYFAISWANHQFAQETQENRLCEINRYAGKIIINDQIYCYRLNEDAGESILIEVLEGATDK